MILQAVFNVTLYAILFKIDKDLSEITRSKLCPHCGGRLRRAYYLRKPRGGPPNIPDECSTRMGLCCARCRKRTLPPSSLYLGRKVHWGAIVLVVTMMRQRRTGGYTIGKLKETFGVSHPTVVRWTRFFRETFPESSAWKERRGAVAARVRSDELPTALVEYFIEIKKDAQQALVACLCFLACGESHPRQHAN